MRACDLCSHFEYHKHVKTETRWTPKLFNKIIINVNVFLSFYEYFKLSHLIHFDSNFIELYSVFRLSLCVYNCSSSLRTGVTSDNSIDRIIFLPAAYFLWHLLVTYTLSHSLLSFFLYSHLFFFFKLRKSEEKKNILLNTI